MLALMVGVRHGKVDDDDDDHMNGRVLRGDQIYWCPNSSVGQGRWRKTDSTWYNFWFYNKTPTKNEYVKIFQETYKNHKQLEVWIGPNGSFGANRQPCRRRARLHLMHPSSCCAHAPLLLRLQNTTRILILLILLLLLLLRLLRRIRIRILLLGPK